MLLEKHKHIVLAFFAFLIALLAYSQFFGLQFPEFDFLVKIVSHSGTGLSEAFNIFTQPEQHYTLVHSINYRPVESFIFWLVLLTNGLNFNAFHALNFLIHAANAFLVFFLAKRLLSDKNGFFSLFAALFFALHPIQMNAVLFPGRLHEPLVVFFLIISLLSLVKFLDSRKQIFLLFSFIACALGVFSKEAGILIPFVLFFYVLVFSEEKIFRKAIIGSLRLCLPFFVLIPLYIALMLFALRGIGGYTTPAGIMPPSFVAVLTLWAIISPIFYPIFRLAESLLFSLRLAFRPLAINIAATFAVAVAFVFSLRRVSKAGESRPARFLLLWLLTFLAAFMAFGMTVYWYAYLFLAPFAVLLAWVFSKGVRFFSSSWFARLGVVIVCLFSIFVFAFSPLFVSYSWPWVAGETTQLVLDETLSLAKDLPPRSKILLLNYPYMYKPQGNNFFGATGLVTDGSTQAFLDFHLPEKKLNVFWPTNIWLFAPPKEADISFECGNCSCILESKNNTAQITLGIPWRQDPNSSGRMVLSPLMVKGGNGLQIFFQGRIQKNTFLFIFDGKKVNKVALADVCNGW